MLGYSSNEFVHIRTSFSHGCKTQFPTAKLGVTFFYQHSLLKSVVGMNESAIET